MATNTHAQKRDIYIYIYTHCENLVRNHEPCAKGLSNYSYLAQIMAAYFTRSVSQPPGYYRALHTRSSVNAQLEADHHSDRPKIGRTALSESEVDGEDMCKVECLVQRRCSKIHLSCLPRRVYCHFALRL